MSDLTLGASPQGGAPQAHYSTVILTVLNTIGSVWIFVLDGDDRHRRAEPHPVRPSVSWCQRAGRDCRSSASFSCSWATPPGRGRLTRSDGFYGPGAGARAKRAGHAHGRRCSICTRGDFLRHRALVRCNSRIISTPGVLITTSAKRDYSPSPEWPIKLVIVIGCTGHAMLQFVKFAERHLCAR